MLGQVSACPFSELAKGTQLRGKIQKEGISFTEGLAHRGYGGEWAQEEKFEVPQGSA
jgi:hypothetical protein